MLGFGINTMISSGEKHDAKNDLVPYKANDHDLFVYHVGGDGIVCH
ncbi:hypothetical protein J31TS6_55120 [Brevibacillus reuszeri]|nr:hypothetical protein J31TS6_55120 [Brevibacillus reuszeri]